MDWLRTSDRWSDALLRIRELEAALDRAEKSCAEYRHERNAARAERDEAVELLRILRNYSRDRGLGTPRTDEFLARIEAGK